MSKLLKIIFIITLFCVLICGVSFATEENFTDEAETTSLDDTSFEETDDTNIGSTSSTSYPGVTNVSPVSDYSEANLGLNNILNIILIAIGVLIILFAIAILIRLKQ